MSFNKNSTTLNPISDESGNIGYNLLIFLLSPFLSLIIACRNFNDKKQRNIILLFFVLFGLTAIISDNTHDAQSWSELFKRDQYLTVETFWNKLTDVFKGAGEDSDIYAILVNFIISRFTDDPRFMFGFHALIFGIFYLKAIGFLFDEFPGTKNINAVIFLILFISVIPIDKIQYVRFWTAAWIYIFAVFNLLRNKT